MKPIAPILIKTHIAGPALKTVLLFTAGILSCNYFQPPLFFPFIALFIGIVSLILTRCNDRAGNTFALLVMFFSGMLASSRPVIANANPDTEVGSIVGEVGLLVPPGEGEALAKAILSLSKDMPLRARMGSAGRKFAQRQLDKQIILSSFESNLANLLANR